MAAGGEPDDALPVGQVEVGAAAEGLEPEGRPLVAPAEREGEGPLPGNQAGTVELGGAKRPPEARGERGGGGGGALGRREVEAGELGVEVQHEIDPARAPLEDHPEAELAGLVDGTDTRAVPLVDLRGDGGEAAAIETGHAVRLRPRRRRRPSGARPGRSRGAPRRGTRGGARRRRCPAPSEPWTRLKDLLMPKSPRIVPAGASAPFVGPIMRPDRLDGAVAAHGDGRDGARGHEGEEAAEERALLVDGVVLLEERARGLRSLRPTIWRPLASRRRSPNRSGRAGRRRA